MSTESPFQSFYDMLDQFNIPNYYEGLDETPDYDQWVSEGRPECDECGDAVLTGRKHFCKVLGKEIVIPEPKRWPL